MKIICTQENLKTGLATVGRIISPSNTLPILNNLLLKTENGSLKISSTNLEIAITTQIRCKIEEEGEVTVFSKTFIDLINNLPNTNVTLNTQNHEIKVETENYHTSLKTLPAEEFPLIPQTENKNQFVLPAQELKKSLEQVVFAASANQTQPEISGVYLGFSEGFVVMAATDRYRLAEKKLKANNLPSLNLSVILPQRSANEIIRIISSQEGQVEVTINDTQAGFVFNQTSLISRLVDGQYPDYRSIIPTQFSASAVVEKKPLTSALKAGGIFSQSSSSVVFEFSKESGNLFVVSESSDVGNSRVEVPAEIEGEASNLVLNFHYVLDCLNAVDSEKVILKIINEDSPAIILPQGDESYIYLVMPIKN